jgi:WD40 repeat protein
VDQVVWLWDIITRKERKMLCHAEDAQGRPTSILTELLDPHGFKTVLSVAFSPDGKTLASADGGFGLFLATRHAGKPWAPRQALVLDPLEPPPGGRVVLWDVATGKRGATLAVDATGLTCVSFSADSKTLAAGSWNSKLRGVLLWDVAAGKERAVLKGHTSAVTCVALSADGKTLASASQDKTVRIWDVSKLLQEKPAK